MLLFFEGTSLARQRKAKSIRDELAQQMELSVKQRLRAEKLYGLSIMDPLTGLHNRRFGEDRLKEEITRAERNGDQLAVIFFDLDYFKEINDQYGHAAGDMALKEFSRKLKRAIRACDIPVRVGGDEFFVILPECPREKVDLILSRIGSPTFKFNGEMLTVRYSVGRAHYQVCDTVETLLARADEMLYEAKASRSGAHARPSAEPEPQKFDGPISLADDIDDGALFAEGQSQRTHTNVAVQGSPSQLGLPTKS
jgi:diguanylate cyclase (GGDEF)-like protein